MNKIKSIWSSITGSLSSAIPLLFACCKSGACVGVCASPITSLFGISTAGLANSPWFGVLEPVLIALSAVSFTISYYNLYVLPKKTVCTTDCACDVSTASSKKVSMAKAIFWIGLIASIGFFSYFEVQKFQSSKAASCSTTVNKLPNQAQTPTNDTTQACCSDGGSCE